MIHPRSLAFRLASLSVLLVTASVATTAVVVSRSTSSSIEGQYARNLAGDANAYAALVGYGATHHSWVGAAAILRSRAGASERIVVTTSARQVLASSIAGAAPPAQAVPAATLDALSPGPGVVQVGGIDARAVGPFALSKATAKASAAAAGTVAQCAKRSGTNNVTVGVDRDGRSYVRVGGLAPTAAELTKICYLTFAKGLRPISVLRPLFASTSRQQAAAKALTAAFSRCLSAAGQSLPANYPSNATVEFVTAVVDLPKSATATQCLGTARRQQLTPYVAPPALLFISGKTSATTRYGLSRSGGIRVALAASVILLVAVVLALGAAVGVTRPLRGLTVAVERMRAGERDFRVPARLSSREVTSLARTFEDMSIELAAAERRRTNMISDVAHELRTPLGNIHGWLEAVQDGMAPPSPELVESLLDESRVLQSLIGDLQDLAASDAHRLVIHPEPINLSDILARVCVAHGAVAARRGVELRVDASPDLFCTADSVRLGQVFSNLVSNALRHTDEGSVVISARIERAESTVVVRVRDTGTGMVAGDVPHAFDRFWRADRSRSRAGGGRGLGLAIAKDLVEAHGGRISLESEEGVGTVVTVYLPTGE